MLGHAFGSHGGDYFLDDYCRSCSADFHGDGSRDVGGWHGDSGASFGDVGDGDNLGDDHNDSGTVVLHRGSTWETWARTGR